MNLTKQYNQIGKDYIKYKRQFFNGKPDLAKLHILSEIGDIMDKTLLDVGCGGGDDILTYVEQGANVFGIDPSKVMVEEAKKTTGLGYKITTESMENASFHKDFFDVVVGRFSITYLQNLDKAFAEIHRLLKDDGKAVMIADHPMNSLAYQKEKVYGNHEIVELPLYHNKVIVRFPAHTFEDYLSPTFNSLFNLINLYEEKKQFQGTNITDTPDFIALTFEKRKKLPSR